MAGTVYIKLEQKTQLMKPDVTIGDLGTVYCKDINVQSYVRTIQLYKFQNVKGRAKNPQRVIISVMQIVKLVQEKYSEYTVINLGEANAVVEKDLSNHGDYDYVCSRRCSYKHTYDHKSD